jgi:hypothetical protein
LVILREVWGNFVYTNVFILLRILTWIERGEKRMSKVSGSSSSSSKAAAQAAKQAQKQAAQQQKEAIKEDKALAKYDAKLQKEYGSMWYFYA